MTRRLAIANAVIAAVILATALVIDVLSTAAGSLNSSIGADVALAPIVILLVAIGAVIVTRHPGNTIGIGMCVTGLLGSLTTFADSYATYTIIASPGALPGAPLAAWFSAWIWIPSILPSLTLLFLVFPDGRLLSSRWRSVLWFDLATIALVWVGFAFPPGPFPDYPQMRNPFGIGSESSALDLMRMTGLMLLVPAIFISAAGLIVRFRRATGQEHQQFKWLIAAALLGGLVFLGSIVSVAVFRYSVFAYSLTFIFAPIPVSVGLAVLRYHLYDIDRIISRTLVYGLVTAGLGAMYFALVIGLQTLLRPVSGGSDLAIVADDAHRGCALPPGASTCAAPRRPPLQPPRL